MSFNGFLRISREEYPLNSTYHTVPACDWCKEQGGPERTLKKCSGCTAILYCSKRCQTAAWPEHKLACRLSSQSTLNRHKELGYRSPMDLGNAIRKWVDVHHYAFATLTHAIALHDGGIDLAIRQPRAMVFLLEPNPEADGNSSTAFRLVDCSLEHRDTTFSVFKSQWSDEWIATRRSDEIAFREDDPDPSFAGLLPVTFYLQGSGISVELSYPLYHPRPQCTAPGGGGDSFVLEEGTKTALAQLFGMYTMAVNMGLVMRVPEDATRILPDVGELCPGRKAKTRRWSPAEGWAWRFLGYASAAQPDPKYKTTRSPRDLLATYQRLWPCHVGREEAMAGSIRLIQRTITP